jgi:hypothetical protein
VTGPGRRVARGIRRTLPPGGEWLPIFTLEGFEVWIIRYDCGHGQVIQFREASHTGKSFILAAAGQMEEGRWFWCMRCPYTDAGRHTRIGGIRRLR